MSLDTTDIWINKNVKNIIIIFIITITQLEIIKKCDLLSQPNSKWTRQDNYQMLFYDASCTIFLKPKVDILVPSTDFGVLMV